MPATVASRSRPPTKKPRASNDPLPPAKKTKLTQTPSASRSAGYSALLNGTPAKIAIPIPGTKINGVRNARKDKVREARAVVGDTRGELDDVKMEDADKSVIVISSAEEDSDDSGSGDEEEQQAPQEDEEAVPKTNGHAKDDDAGMDEPEEPSLGEKLQAQEPEAAHTTVVDVEEAFGQDADVGTLATASSKKTLTTSTHSLGTVLAQALRTNDKDLLDSALRISDVDSIYATVERLPSPLVANLLQKLADYLYKRPSRAGLLMVWFQVSLSAHGGYLASQPQLVKQLASLNRVLRLRGAGLQPLLQLKGRLDMLQAQVELRKRHQRMAALGEENEAVIYVEGEDDVSSADEDEADDDLEPGVYGKMIQDRAMDEDASSVDEMPTTMEMDDASEEDSDDDELIDDEAEETDEDDGDDISEPMSDDDMDGEDVASASEEESRPARRSTVGRAGTTRRY